MLYTHIDLSQFLLMLFEVYFVCLSSIPGFSKLNRKGANNITHTLEGLRFKMNGSHAKTKVRQDLGVESKQNIQTLTYFCTNQLSSTVNIFETTFLQQTKKNS